MNKAYVFLLSYIAALGGLMFGFDTAIISGTLPFIRDYFRLNDLQLGWAVGSLLIGCILGAAISGRLSDLYGRKRILIFIALLFALSSLASAVATSFFVFVSARILGGIAVGAASLLSPLYIAEISPSAIRGKLVSFNQLSITFGILVSYLINYFLSDIGDDNWRLMFASGTIPSVLFFLLLFFVPESPRWLVKNARLPEAYKLLKKIGGEENAVREMEIIGAIKEQKKEGILKLLNSEYKTVLWIGVILAVFVQITGINTIIYYAPIIFQKAGNSINTSLLQTFLIGLIMFLFAFVSTFTVDKFGRKPLYLVGSIGMSISMLALSITFFLNVSEGLSGMLSILIYIAFFAAFIGPVFWILMSEIFPGKIRGTIMSIAVFTVWVTNFLVSQFFPYLLEKLGGGITFSFFTVMSLLMFVFTLFYLPETKGKTLEQIEDYWLQKNH